jgi:hypothetical protein
MFDFKFKNDSSQELDRFVSDVLDNITATSGTRRKQMFKNGHGLPEPKNAFSITYGYCNVGYLSKEKSIFCHYWGLAMRVCRTGLSPR